LVCWGSRWLRFQYAVQAQRARHHQIPTARYRVPAYEVGLKRRGDLTLWVDESAVAGWAAPRRTTQGGQSLYSDVAIRLVLTQVAIAIEALNRMIRVAKFA
jgi:hypothetical protein